MKKIVNVALFLLFVVASANAQLFVGGGFSISTEGGSIKRNGNSEDKESSTSFFLEPKLGYFLSEKFAVGGKLIISASKGPDINNDVKKTSAFGLAPFARYYMVNFNKFSLFGEAELSFVFGNTKYENNNVTTDGPKTTSIGLNVTPGVAFALSDKIELEGKINLFSFGYNHHSEKTNNNNNEVINNTSTFGFGAGLDNIVNTGNFSIGAIFKF
jgi:hypothetical protein